MAAQCLGITRTGKRCSSPPVAGSSYCFVHAPEKAEARIEASRKGGRARSNRERAKKAMPAAMTADELAGWLSTLFTAVISGETEPKIAQAAATVARTLLEARAAGELEQRLADLEARADVGPQRWRA